MEAGGEVKLLWYGVRGVSSHYEMEYKAREVLCNEKDTPRLMWSRHENKSTGKLVVKYLHPAMNLIPLGDNQYELGAGVGALAWKISHSAKTAIHDPCKEDQSYNVPNVFEVAAGPEGELRVTGTGTENEFSGSKTYTDEKGTYTYIWRVKKVNVEYPERCLQKAYRALKECVRRAELSSVEDTPYIEPSCNEDCLFDCLIAGEWPEDYPPPLQPASPSPGECVIGCCKNLEKLPEEVMDETIEKLVKELEECLKRYVAETKRCFDDR